MISNRNPVVSDSSFRGRLRRRLEGTKRVISQEFDEDSARFKHLKQLRSWFQERRARFKPAEQPTEPEATLNEGGEESSKDLIVNKSSKYRKQWIHPLTPETRNQRLATLHIIYVVLYQVSLILCSVWIFDLDSLVVRVLLSFGLVGFFSFTWFGYDYLICWCRSKLSTVAPSSQSSLSSEATAATRRCSFLLGPFGETNSCFNSRVASRIEDGLMATAIVLWGCVVIHCWTSLIATLIFLIFGT